MTTNLHTHGIHDAPGLQSQSLPVKYTGRHPPLSISVWPLNKLPLFPRLEELAA